MVLLVLAIPVLSLRLGFSDESNFADDTTTKQAYDLLVEGFGPGFNGPLILVAELPEGTDPGDLSAITEAAAADPGVAFVSEPRPNDPDNPTAAMWKLVPTSGPQDEATTDLVNRLRDDVLPAGRGRHRRRRRRHRQRRRERRLLATTSSSRLPYFFAAVLALSFLLLMVVFRSLLVPLKAVIMNLLSIGAAYGIVVALFQWGWLSDLTDVQPAPIEPWVPMMLFAIVFGLSMDYEVFLLSRVREEWHRTGDSRTSVADGLAATAKVITAAAAIMVVVFGSFILENDRVREAHGHRPRDGDPARRHHRPDAAGAGHDGAARRPQLVAAALARPDPPQHRRRGPCRTGGRGGARGRAHPGGRPVIGVRTEVERTDTR